MDYRDRLDKKRKSFLGVIVLLMLLQFAVLGITWGAPAPQDWVRDVRCTEIAFSQTVERRDVEAFKKFIDPDSRWGSGPNPHIGPDAIAASWAAFFAEDGQKMRWRPQTVQVRDDGIALSHGPYRSTRVDDAGNAIESWGHFTSTWQRDPDTERWRIIFDLGGDHGMTPSEDDRALLEADPDC